MDIQVDTHYRHKKSGNSYTVIAAATLQIDDSKYDMIDMVVYSGDDGRVWVRPMSEFEDRFEELT